MMFGRILQWMKKKKIILFTVDRNFVSIVEKFRKKSLSSRYFFLTALQILIPRGD